MIGCLRTLVRKQPIIALYFEFENEVEFYEEIGRAAEIYSNSFLNSGSGTELIFKIIIRGRFLKYSTWRDISVTSNATCLKIAPNTNTFFVYTPL